MVSDRNVIDTQLQEAIFAFERTTGVVATITSESGAKSSKLAEALAGGKKIVVCTIQTFPFALAAVQELAATSGKRFAVIADEAHSSQTGEAASKLKQVLSAEELAAVQDGGEISTEDILAAQMSATYILDFANSADDILAAFKTYHTTAELENVTDPNQVLDLRAKLDGLGYYDDFEVDRVVKAELNPKASHAELSAALEPVADRLLKVFKAARQTETNAKAQGNETAATEAKQTQDALIVFKSNMSAYLRLYAFLSQIFDYGSTAVEARSIFFRRLIPLLEFGREREGVDLSKVVLTHHKLTTSGKLALTFAGAGEKLQPMTEAGSASVQDKEKALLSQILQKLNDLFTGDLSDNDQLSWVTAVKGKLIDNQTLVHQSQNNLKEQFENSPILTQAIVHAITEALDTHGAMSKQALQSATIQQGLKEALMGPGRLYETLRDRAA